MNAPGDNADDTAPDHWKTAVAEFAEARLELLRLELADAKRSFGKRATLLAALSIGAVGTWALLMAGLIGWLAASGKPWWGFALALAGLHLLLAAGAIFLLRRPAPPTFPLTRNELLKDREWLRNLQKTTRHKR